jgi:acyl carrier protein
MDETRNVVRQFILTEFLPGEDPEELTDSTPLISGGILDSLAILRLSAFLEETFGIEVKPYERSPEYLDTITVITEFVASKM